MSAEPVERDNVDPVLAHQGTWTDGDFLALPRDEGQRAELIDGSLIVSPHGDVRHQNLGFRLCREFERLLPDGLVAVHEANVRLRSGTIPVPDVVVTRDLGEPLVLEVDDVVLLAEVVSASEESKRRDRVLKSVLYADAGVAWYLRVEQEDELELVLHRLVGRHYVEHARSRQGGHLDLSEFGFALEVDALSRRR